MDWLKKNWLLLLVHLGAWVPLIWLGLAFALGYLSINPIQDLTFATGEGAIRLLVLSLACTPISIVFGWRQVLPLRKWLGLYAFLYAMLHFIIFIWLDYGLNLELVWADGLVQKPYIIVGFISLLILLPLAITSNQQSMRLLKKNWKRLHQLVYLAAILAVLHFLWARKSAFDPEALVYGGILAALLIVRIPAVRKSITNYRRGRGTAAAPS